MLIIFTLIKYATPLILLLMSISLYNKKRENYVLLIVVGLICVVLGEVIIFAAPLQGNGIGGESTGFGAFSTYLFISKALYSFGTVMSLMGLFFLVRKS